MPSGLMTQTPHSGSRERQPKGPGVADRLSPSVLGDKRPQRTPDGFGLGPCSDELRGGFQQFRVDRDGKTHWFCTSIPHQNDTPS